MVEPILGPPERLLVHQNNLARKASRAVSPMEKGLVGEAQMAYETYVATANASFAAGGAWVAPSVVAMETYLVLAKRLEWQSSLFSWRSDFAGSVIPEYLIRFTWALLVKGGLTPIFTTRDSVVGLTLTGAGRGWTIRRKNQDFCVGLEEIRLESSGGHDTVLLPLVVAEVKTNLDINKLSGLDFSAESLKRSFTGVHYFVVTETVDFSRNDNYVAGNVDEIYVLRKAMRSRHRRLPVGLQASVFETFLDDATHIVAAAGTNRGHVYERLATGKLIVG